MIEHVFLDRCTACGTCADVCPAMVFDLQADGVPVIARQADCQTCYQCELYCQADALYVSPEVDRPGGLPLEDSRPLLGQYRRQSGWHEYADDPRYSNEHWRMDTVFARARSNRPS